MIKYKTMDANEAVSQVAYKFSEVCGIYPITPASPMAEHVDRMSVIGEKNYFGNKVNVVEMQSEAGAIAMVHGALQSGVLATTFTASQGLLLMIPNLYKLAGEMLPGVIHVAARSLSTHALSIFGDHQDIYAARSTGVCMLASSSVQEAYYMAAIAHLSAIKSSLPFINFFDGFRTSHEIDKIKLMDLDKIEKLIDKNALNDFRKRAMNSSNPTTRGTAENEDIYFQHTESRNKDYDNVVAYVEEYMNKINKINDIDIKLFNYYGDKKAANIIVAMGSVCDTIRETIDYLNSKGMKYGLVEVHLFRPFSCKYLLSVIPSSVKNIAVLDRSKEANDCGEALYLDVVNTFKGKNVNIYGGRYGLSSKNTDPVDIKAVFDFLESKNVHSNFTIGITDDVTKLSLKRDESFVLPNKMQEFLIYGYGSDGMVSTSKDLIKIIGDNTKKYVQGYFQYDSKKSGGVTRSHIRISDDMIRRPYYVKNPSLVVISKDNYIYKYDLLDNMVDGGTILLNSNLDDDKLVKSLPNKVKYLMAKKKLKFYVIDAYKLAFEYGLGNKISTCMEMCIFHLLKIIGDKKVISIMKESNEKRFGDKGKKVVDANNSIIDKSIYSLRNIKVSSSWLNLVYFEKENKNFYDFINNLDGDNLPVSAFLDKKSGIYKGGNTIFEKRAIAEKVPCWISENCIECNQCSFVCPHGVIRPFLTSKEDKNVDSIPSILPKDVNYSIGVSYEDCTGCGLCFSTCPGKNGKKAIEMVQYDREKYKQEDFNYLMNNNINGSYKPKLLNVKNVGFIQPKFEFSGSCAGCGEAYYLKNLTQVFNDNLFIANATGCSSIYGGNIPSLPYSVPWASSLFEDNSEFGLGILYGLNVKRNKIENYMRKNISRDRKLFKDWLDNKDNYDICLEVSKKIDYDKHKELIQFKDYITPKSVWVVGGDGFAYDIGYGGLDHVLSRNDNINILVLDTEVYSNTGGQASKSSNMGAVASFAKGGKETYKKDLAKIAMCYPNVYVATCNIGYNKEQYLKALKEASEHNGPSLVIVYSPCIEQGIKMGMGESLIQSNLATKCGYYPIFRYNPDINVFTMDSKNTDFDLYDEFLSHENRYASLKKNSIKEAEILLDNQKKWARKRFEYYSKLDSNK